MPKRATIDPEAAERASLFLRLKGWVRNSLDQHSDWYAEARECFGFVAGRSLEGKGQWPGSSWEEMKATGRQPVEFNRVGPIVDAVCGLEVNNRQEVKFLPRTQGDVAVNERLSSLAEWARDEAHAEDEESEMFRNAVICGRGFTETRIDFDEEATGKIVIDNLDPLECGVDPGAKKACFTDARYFWRYRDLDADEAKAMFDLEPAVLNATWAGQIDIKDGGEGFKNDYPDETRSGLKAGDKPRTVRVVQIQWWERERVMLVAMPGAAEPTEMSVEAWAEMQAEAEAQGVVAERIERRRYRQAFLGHGSILADVVEKDGFTIRAVTGRYDRNLGYHYGIVRPMRDPQMLANKTLSQVLHILNTNAKGGLLIEAGAFKNPRDAEKDWSNPAKSITLNEGGINKIKERTAPPLPPTLTALQDFSLSSIRDVTGVSVEMLGLADRDQAASLEYQRRQSAMTILAGLFNGLRLYRKLQGKTLLGELRQMPPGVLVRVLIDPEVARAEYEQALMAWQQQAQAARQAGQPIPAKPEAPGAEFLSSTKRGEVFDPAKFGLGANARFDVIVDETPSSPNQKEATWAALQPFMAQMPPQAVPLALKYSPLPETAAKELGDAIAKAAEGPEIPPQLMQQLEGLQAENEQLKGRQQTDAGKLGVQFMDAQTRRMKVEQDGAEDLRAMVEELARNQAAIINFIQGSR